jgi:catechol 1,2-dioxygenase
MIRTYQDVTPAVLKVMEQTTDPRLREITTALVRHLHGFIVETHLTEEEFRTATAILAEMGRLTTQPQSSPRWGA